MTVLLARNKPCPTRSTTKIVAISKFKEFEIPAVYLENKNQVASIVNWWFNCLAKSGKKSNVTYQSQLRPAKRLLQRYEFVDILYAVQRAVGGKYIPTLWGILKNPKWAGLE